MVFCDQVFWRACSATEEGSLGFSVREGGGLGSTWPREISAGAIQGIRGPRHSYFVPVQRCALSPNTSKVSTFVGVRSEVVSWASRNEAKKKLSIDPHLPGPFYR